jgi:uncharacterized protein YutE (UPF0331/DUF86 family)
MVDARRAEARIQRLEDLLERLEAIQAGGLDAYLADQQLQAAAEHWLQTAIQICIDLGTQVVMEISAPAPSNYADIFTILGQKGVVSDELASRMAAAARQRNLIVHLYMEVEDRAVFASLEHLGNLREFAGMAKQRLG